jgi:hypothetical protein
MFNTFLNVNDPRESQCWNFVVNLNLAQSPNFDEVSERVSNDLKNNIKIVCFSKDRKEAVHKWQPEALLDRGFARPSMWHHYADKHKGVCLMFDRDKLDITFKQQINEERLIASNVRYSDEGILCTFGNNPFYIDLNKVNSQNHYYEILTNHLSKWTYPLFFTKLKDWNNEEEYRWIYFDNNPKPIFLKFNDALKAIIIGEKVSKEYENELLKYCVIYKADKCNLNWNNGFPKIEFPSQPYITNHHLIGE